MKAIGQRLKERRKSLGLNQAQLGEIIGCKTSHASNIERGYVKPSGFILEKINMFLEDRLVYGDGSAFEEFRAFETMARAMELCNWIKEKNLEQKKHAQQLMIANATILAEMISVFEPAIEDMPSVASHLTEEMRSKAIDSLTRIYNNYVNKDD
jgi:DNA-binding XRE family transcriptional regulator